MTTSRLIPPVVLALGLLQPANALAQALPTAPAAATQSAPAALTAQAMINSPGSSNGLAQADVLYRKAVRNLVDRARFDPQSSETTSATQHQMTVVADRNDIVGRARFYFKNTERTNWIATFTAPLSGSNATFATQNGLGRNSTANIGLKINAWSRVTTPQSTGAAPAAMQAGNYRTALNSVLPEPLTVPASLELLRRAALARRESGVRSSDAAQGMLPGAGLAPASAALAAILESDALIRSPERFFAAVVQDPTVVKATWSAVVTPGFEWSRSAGDYLNTDSNALDSFDENLGAVSFSAGLSRVAVMKTDDGKELNAPRFFAGLTLRGGRSVKVPDARNVCLPATAGILECSDLPVGTITTSGFNALTVEIRYWEIDNGLGINPKYTTTFQKVTPSDDSGVRVHIFEVPVYLMRKVSDIAVPDVTYGADLVGGINFGYRSGGAQPGAFVSLFLTKAFGLP